MNSYPTDDKENRLRSVIDGVIGTEDPEELMMELMEALNDSVTPVPEVGKYYTFIYIPKTSGIQYDSHPLVAVTDVFRWGFKGLNYHWGEMRQYTWNEVVGQMYEIYTDELSDAREIPFAKISLNS
tara:strand:+ start:3232 stop:3609 length:378 start_codon:yes stop_codon:yes gene_type:complete